MQYNNYDSEPTNAIAFFTLYINSDRDLDTFLKMSMNRYRVPTE